jgi:hypothetical protein
MPPEPEFPDDWHMDDPPQAHFSAPATPMDDMLTLEHLEPAIESAATLDPSINSGQAVRPLTKPVESQTSNVIPAPQEEPVHIPPIAPPPLPEPAADDGKPARLITVFLRPSGDSDRDRRRIKYVYGILISNPGKDRFQFQIFENNKGHLIDFPNDTTRIAPEMLTRLKKLMGEESWRVEEITYQ